MGLKDGDEICCPLGMNNSGMTATPILAYANTNVAATELQKWISAGSLSAASCICNLDISSESATGSQKISYESLTFSSQF